MQATFSIRMETALKTFRCVPAFNVSAAEVLLTDFPPWDRQANHGYPAVLPQLQEVVPSCGLRRQSSERVKN
jgi:hypothetical protein